LPSGPVLTLPAVPLAIASTLPILSASIFLVTFLIIERRYRAFDSLSPDGLRLAPLDPPPRW